MCDLQVSGLWWWQGHRFCEWYCGLLPTFIIKENTEFQLKVIENKDVTFHPNSSTPWIPSMDSLNVCKPQVKDPVPEC